jgi:uncharacterized membrane protein YfcA
MDGAFVGVCAAAFCGFGTQATAGFGGLVVSLTLGALLLPIDTLLPLLVPVSLIITGTIALRHRAHIDWRLLTRRLLPCMAAGAAIGLTLFHTVQGPWLRRAFGALVVLLAARELLCRLRPGAGDAPRDALPARRTIPLMVGAGVIHGIYASGGPMLVYAIGRSGLAKASFRSTLCVVFVSLNTGLSIVYLAGGRLGAAQLPELAVLAPVVVAALFTGEWLHRRVDERRFRLLVYSVLLVAGSVLMVR